MSNINTNLCYMAANNATQTKKDKEKPLFRNPIETFKAQDTKGKAAYVALTGATVVGYTYALNNFPKIRKAKRELNNLEMKLMNLQTEKTSIGEHIEIPQIKNKISDTKNKIKKAKVKIGIGFLVPLAASLIARAFINQDV